MAYRTAISVDSATDFDGVFVNSDNDFKQIKKEDFKNILGYDAEISTLNNEKVSKEDGKGLSTNDYTTVEKEKLASLSNYDDTEIKKTITTNTKDIDSLTKTKVDKIDGMGLSTNDYTNSEKEKLASLKNYEDAEVKESIATNTKDIDSLMETLTNLNNYLLERLGLIEGVLPKVSTLPVLYLTGDITEISDTNKVIMNCKLIDTIGIPIFKDKKCKIKWQGNGSLQYPKKNYSIDLLNEDGTKYNHKFFDDVEANNSYHVKANYTDGGSQARNIVTVNLAKECYNESLPSNCRGCIDGFPILVYINDENKGLYTWNLKQHYTIYNIDTKNPNHLCYRAGMGSGAVAFRALSEDNSEDVFADWEDKIPGTNSEEGRQKLNRLLGWVMSCENNPDKFRQECDQYFNIEYLIDYLCWMYIACMYDSAKANMNIVTYDGIIWYPTGALTMMVQG